ncbi:MAG TPA: hypothetical protein VGN26_15165 [Armatimonadota bacterium]|jgi:hypothetical protein
MELRGRERAELASHFTHSIPGFDCLGQEDQDRLLDMAEGQLEKRLPDVFVWAGVRSTSALLLEMSGSAQDVSVRQFMEQNASSLRDAGSARTQPRREVKLRARERLLESTRGLLREARSARQPHERKKMRRTLLGLDQRHLIRVLGREGQELCHQINDYLSRSRDLR